MWKIFYIHFISIVKWRVSDRSVTFKFSRFCHFKSFFWVISTSTWPKIKSKLSWEHADFEVMAKIKLATFLWTRCTYIHTCFAAKLNSTFLWPPHSEGGNVMICLLCLPQFICNSHFCCPSRLKFSQCLKYLADVYTIK